MTIEQLISELEAYEPDTVVEVRDFDGDFYPVDAILLESGNSVSFVRLTS